MAFDTLLNKVDIPRDQIHLMDTSLPPEAAACQYAESLYNYFGTDVLPTRRHLTWFCLGWEMTVIHFHFSQAHQQYMKKNYG